MFRKSATDAAMRDRSRSQVIASSALETIREQKGQLVNGGLSRLSFFTGVANSLLIAFVVGKFPEYYWLLHLVEAAVLMPIHTAHLCRIKRGLAILEVCWVTNVRRKPGFQQTARPKRRPLLRHEPRAHAPHTREGLRARALLRHGTERTRNGRA